MDEPNKYYRPVHRPHRKLRFPGMGSGSDDTKTNAEKAPRRTIREASSDWGEDWIPKLVPLVVVAFIGFVLWDSFRGGGKGDDIVRDPAAIEAATWENAKVRRKYAEVTPKRSRYFLELEDAEGKRVVFDFEREKSMFWDQVDPRNRLTKAAGSNQVAVDTYTRDTTLVMKFE